MSIHKSKGLEFKAVIHLGLEAWVFPRMTRRHGQWILQDLDGDKIYIMSRSQELKNYAI